MKEENILDKPLMTTVQWLSLLGSIIIIVGGGVFTLTMIYSEFLLSRKDTVEIRSIHESDKEAMKILIKDNFEVLLHKHQAKDKRDKENFGSLWTEVSKLRANEK